jgi:arylsulfatase A-like enzyme
MNRREFVGSGVAASVAATVPLAAAAEAPKPKKMNVLYVFGDEHRACSMPGQPLCNVVAPTFEKFAKENFVMENCISSYPLCTPYRAILISGRWPSQTGIDRNGQGMDLPATEYGLGQAFKDNGYNTSYVGKWHLYKGETSPVPKGPLRFGFDHFQIWGNTNNHWHDYWWDQNTDQKNVVNEWAPTAMTTQAIDFLKTQKGEEKPWMMVVSWNPPHPPFDPPADDAKLYNAATVPLRPNVAFKRSNGETSPRLPLKNEANLRDSEAGYFGAITGVDKEFQRLLDALDKLGMADNTVVVYSSDHGEMMGTKCRMAKQVPWEESCHVPFYVRVPGAKQGTSTDLIGGVDVYPTLCGLGGFAPPKSAMGRDMSPAIRGEKSMARDAIVFMNQDMGDKNDAEAVGHRSVRTLTHTYSVASDGRWLLYDNVKDPYQMTNLINDPAQKPLMEKLDQVLFDWQKEVGDKFPLKELVKKQSKQPC